MKALLRAAEAFNSCDCSTIQRANWAKAGVDTGLCDSITSWIPSGQVHSTGTTATFSAAEFCALDQKKLLQSLQLECSWRRETARIRAQCTFQRVWFSKYSFKLTLLCSLAARTWQPLTKKTMWSSESDLSRLKPTIRSCNSRHARCYSSAVAVSSHASQSRLKVDRNFLTSQKRDAKDRPVAKWQSWPRTISKSLTRSASIFGLHWPAQLLLKLR